VPPTRTPTPTFTPEPARTTSPSNTPTATPSPTFTPTPPPTPTPTPRIEITDIRELGRLETVEYVMQTVLNIEKEPETTWQRITGIFGTDKILLIASGEVVAGVDLGKLHPANVQIDEDRIALRLPPPEIFYTRIDNDETRVYLREKGLLYRFDKDLETAARRKAERQLTDWALQHGVLEKAQSNAISELERLLHTLGFTQIAITVQHQH
jgi:hypothetical protein